MAGNIFKNIIDALSFTDILYQYFNGNFSEGIHMIGTWIEHIKDVFISSWVSCLDESIYILTNNFTCPGWMFVPRMPHFKEVFYHTM